MENHNHHSSGTSPVRSSGIPRISRLPAPKPPSTPAPPSASVLDRKTDIRSTVKHFSASVRATPVKTSLPRAAATPSFRASVSGATTSTLPTPRPRTSITPAPQRHSVVISDRSSIRPASSLARPISRLAQVRRPPPSSHSSQTSHTEDTNDQLGSLDGFRAASRQSFRDISPPSSISQDVPIADEDVTPRPKKASRPSLSDRTVESLSRLPPTPASDRRRSSFFSPQSPMGPPPRPVSAMSTPLRRDVNNTSFVKPTTRPLSAVKRVQGTSAITNRPTNLQSSAKIPPRRSISVGQPHVPVHKRTVPPTAPAATPAVLSSISSRTGASRPAGANKPSVRNGVGASNPQPRTLAGPVRQSQFQRPRVSNIAGRDVNASEDHTPVQDKTASSSAVLRQQIARAKAMAKRTAGLSQAIPQLDGSSDQEFDLASDPFNAKPKQDKNKLLLRKRIDAARADGRLNIAAMGLQSIPDEVMSMYDADQMADSALAWNETVDLVRFIAADNDLETITDEVFPDVGHIDEAANEDEDGPISQFGGLEMLDLHGNRLQAIPPGLRRLERLTVLNLAHNKLGNTIFDTISQIESLHHLTLSNNNISGYLPKTIGRLKNLKSLDLQSNKILNLPEDLRELVALQVLNVSHNALTGLPMDALESLPLSEINAASNSLVGALFPFGVTGFTRLQTLLIENNSLASLAFSENLSLPALKTLSLANNRIMALPDISGWNELSSIAAAENKIATFPTGFTTLKGIKQVDLSGNEIMKLDDNIGTMHSLVLLKISANPLKERKFLDMSTEDIKQTLRSRLKPEDVKGRTDDFEDEGIDIQSPSDSLTQWKVVSGTLDLRDRSLNDEATDELRSVLGTEDVRDLKLSHNRFTSIPFEISLAQNLRVLDMSSCVLGHEYLTEVLNLQSLQELYLTNNRITSWDPLLENLNAPRLAYLDMSNNRLIGSLPVLSQTYPELKVLYAADNRIDAISAESLAGLHSADLSNNNIGYLPPDIGLLWFSGLKGLNVGGNAFRMPNYRVLEKGTETTLEWLREKIPEHERVVEVETRAEAEGADGTF